MTNPQVAPVLDHVTKQQTVKCVVWDLDHTLWDGVLLEDESVTLRPAVVEIIKILDSRGILHSIASRNDYNTAMRKLEQFSLQDYFLYPQINWNAKSDSLKTIAQSINIGIDTLAFVDDQSFEREEVAFSLPEILCIAVEDLDTMLDLPMLNPRFITEDSHLRRLLYLSDIQRNQAEKEFIGPNEAFLATLGMSFTISSAQESDLQRAEELTLRTHQLNTTGYSYSYDELNAFRHSPNHILLIASLDDKYGTYGKIGLALIEKQAEFWTIKLLLMSCRVMSRGVGTVLMNHIMRLAEQAQVRLRAEFISNDRNRLMHVTYKFGGFRQISQERDLILFEHDLSQIQPMPPYIRVQIED